MKPLKLSCLLAYCLFMLAIEGHAQVTYEQGYIIDNDNNKTEGLIQNKDWKDNPTKFNYKPQTDVEPVTATIEQIKEFGIGNTTKYIRAKVNIDRSSPMVKDLSEVRNPVWKEEQLFLNVVVEGPATLYIYEDKDLTRFFYKVEDTEVQQLIYKKYQENGGVAENKAFLGQLNYALNCDAASAEKLSSLRYTENDLRSYFQAYNECVGEESVVYKEKSKNNFNLKLTPGVNYSHVAVESIHTKISGETNKKPYFRLGLEGELILPFNKNKWGVIAESSFQHHKSWGTNEIESYYDTITVDYKYIDLSLGLRHYFFLNEKSKLFINGALVVGYNLEPSTVKIRSDWRFRNYELESLYHFAFGAGFQHNRISTELRYHASEDLAWEYKNTWANYNRLSLIFGYRIL